jgi:DNA primase
VVQFFQLKHLLSAMVKSSIHPSTVEAVRQVATENIVEIISDSVVLKKSGREFMGRCPFHDDSTPSFSVNPTKGVYHCHGCGEGGDAIAFFRKTSTHEFADAIVALAERFNVPVEYKHSSRDYQKEKSLLEELREIHNAAVAFYQRQLNLSPVAKQYLSDHRHITPETANTWKLGYAPDSWDSLFNHLTSKNFSPDSIERAGLIVKRESGGYYDRFRNRLMIPICDEKGVVIAFTGRTLGDDQAKYLNSPETLLFQKARVLFGLDRAKDAIASIDQAIIVEGHLDVISLHQAGISNVVGVMGTALSVQHIKQVCRYTQSNRVVLGMDSDKAGIDATHKAIAELTPLATDSIDLKVISLPEGKDADEFVTQHGADAYRSLVDKALSWVEWKFDRICIGNLSDAQAYQKAATQLVEIIASLNPTAFVPACDKAARILASRSGFSPNAIIASLQTALAAWNRKVKAKPVTPTHSKPERSVLETAELTVLAIYQNCKEYQAVVKGELEKRGISFSHCRDLFHSLHSGDYEAIASYNQKHGLEAHWATIREVEESLIRCLNYMQIQQLHKQRKYCLERWSQAGDNEKDREYYDAQNREACAEIDRLRSWNPVPGESILNLYYQEPIVEAPVVELQPQVEMIAEPIVEPVVVQSIPVAPLPLHKPSPVDEKRGQLMGLCFRKLQNAKGQRDIESIAKQYAGVVQEVWERLPEQERDRLCSFDLSSLNLLSQAPQPEEFLNQYLEDLEKGAIASEDEAISLFTKAEQIGAAFGETLNDYWVRVSAALANFLERVAEPVLL